jgi:hypothetical protein
MKIRWREVFKFLSGAAFAGSLANFYLWLTGISVPFMGYTITPTLLGVRAVVSVVLCVVFFYLGWLRGFGRAMNRCVALCAFVALMASCASLPASVQLLPETQTTLHIGEIGAISVPSNQRYSLGSAETSLVRLSRFHIRAAPCTCTAPSQPE